MRGIIQFSGKEGIWFIWGSCISIQARKEPSKGFKQGQDKKLLYFLFRLLWGLEEAQDEKRRGYCKDPAYRGWMGPLKNEWQEDLGIEAWGNEAK